VLILELRILVQWSIVLTLTLQWKMRHWAPAWLNLRMPLKLSVLFRMLQLVVARMLFQHSVPPITMRMKEGVRIRWMLVCPTICPLVELDLLELCMDPIQILRNVPDRAMRSSMLRWRGDKAVDLLAYDVDPYEDAMRDDSNGGFNAFLPSKSHSVDPNIPHGEVCIHLSWLFNFKSVLYFLVNTFCLPRLFVSVVFLIWIVSMTGIVPVSKMW
jgi:hypothetical protein